MELSRSFFTPSLPFPLHSDYMPPTLSLHPLPPRSLPSHFHYRPLPHSLTPAYPLLYSYKYHPHRHEFTYLIHSLSHIPSAILIEEIVSATLVTILLFIAYNLHRLLRHTHVEIPAVREEEAPPARAH